MYRHFIPINNNNNNIETSLLWKLLSTLRLTEEFTASLGW